MKGSDLAYVATGKEGSVWTRDEFAQIDLAVFQTAMQAQMAIYGERLTRLSHKVIYYNKNC